MTTITRMGLTGSQARKFFLFLLLAIFLSNTACGPAITEADINYDPNATPTAMPTAPPTSEPVVVDTSDALQSSAGGVDPVASGETLYMLIAALRGEIPGQFFMESEQLFMVAWPKATSWCFAIFTKSGKAFTDFAMLGNLNANKVAELTFADFVKYLQNNGWVITDTLPGPLGGMLLQVQTFAAFFMSVPVIMVPSEVGGRDWLEDLLNLQPPTES